MNSYIFTLDGLSIVANGKHYVVTKTHRNYDAIKNAMRAKDFDSVEGLINVAAALVDYAQGTKIEVDAEAGVVLYNGTEVDDVIADHILEMLADDFDIMPMVKLLGRIMSNPSERARKETYGWIRHNGMTITEEGFIVAWKRVKDDFTSFYDNKTMHTVGERTVLDRSQCDQDSTNTCSRGLHFCSHAYLPQYMSGRGQVLMLELDPADIVAIPTDYQFSKGRACGYKVVDALNGDARKNIEVKDILPQPVLAAAADVNKSDAYKRGYVGGYKDGRGKKAISTSLDLEWYDDQTADMRQTDREAFEQEMENGYNAGRSDGRNRLPKLY